MSGYAVAHLDEIDEISDGREPCRPVRHHFGITAFGVNAWTGREAGERIINEHDESDYGRGALPRPAGARRVRARRRSGGRARRHLRLRPPRRDADGVRRGARDDDRRVRRHPGRGLRARRLGALGAALAPLRGGRVRRGRRSPPRAWSTRIRSTPCCSTTSPAARASPAGRPTRSTTSGTRSSGRSGSARSHRTIPTSIRSATTPRSRN